MSESVVLPASQSAAPRRPESALYEQVAQQLRSRILSNALPPGSWIDEQALAAEYGISRTPLREALKVLAAEGLVTMKLRRGAYVTEVSKQDLAEIVHLLGLLESDAAIDAAQGAGDAELAELETLHRDIQTAAAAAAGQASAEGAQALADAIEALHLHVLRIAGNGRRETMVCDLRRMMKLSPHRAAVPVQTTVDELGEVVAAMKERNWARAKRLMREHLAPSGSRRAMEAS